MSRPTIGQLLNLLSILLLLLLLLLATSLAHQQQQTNKLVNHHYHQFPLPFTSEQQQNGNNNNNFSIHFGNDFNQQNSDKQDSPNYEQDYFFSSETNTKTNDDQQPRHTTNDGQIDRTLSSFDHLNRLPADKEYLSHHLANKACKLDRGCQRSERLNNTYLNYCTRYKLENLLSNQILMSILHDSSDGCEKILDEFIQLDELINQFNQLFKNLLTRYNCHNGYSVKWSCDDCKKAYKDWLCATNLPYYMNGERIKPCISFCERVEQRCPYLHPITKEQYGGQPVFICKDPNIPFVPEITPDILYSEPAKCYDMCHLSDNLTELITDSLSKYDYDKCPDKGSIAEEVRSDPMYCRLDHQQQQPSSISSSNESKTVPNDQYGGSSTEYPQIDEPILNGINDTTIDRNPILTFDSSHKIQPTEPHAHNKKLNDLKEVLAIYKSQPKTHKFWHHSEHSSALDTPKSSESSYSAWSLTSRDR